MASHVKMVLNKLNLADQRVENGTKKAVAAVAFAVERDAKLAAPVDLGVLRASIYTRTCDSDGRPAAISKALSLSDGAETIVEDAGNEASKFKAVVGCGVVYGIYQEMGFKHHGSGENIPGQFFMLRSAKKHRAKISKVVAQFIVDEGLK